MTAKKARDHGQAFPIYIAVIAAMLFAALAFVVVGMAGDTRSEAQAAADAAALAAAREARDDVFVGLSLVDLKPTDWEGILEGARFDARGACREAESFASQNNATAECEVALPRFTVSVTTARTVGESVVPGTGAQHGKASATAVIKPLCSLDPAPVPTAAPVPPDDGVPKPDSVNITCVGRGSFEVDPLHPGQLSKLARALFSVRLVS
ncbi:pilus assembly protein TadG-related protein [Streptomyces sp. H34-S4]|uniref:pilus assembly protein TadG-related protein n=1 Tax=Streptomyces sp. H34-S4 TaxID=2996463 RepID=UPI00226F6DC6|nr:pilus assembly protein TadG-related protein [Streptomyces sp. H34-S4]MCY0932720.1 pilus assembly protein TadG-related protein [Streptomyces sp. H34-S4]